MLRIVGILLLATCALSEDKVKGIVVIKGINVTGQVTFVQETDYVTITGQIEGLTPGKHGFHVHAKGDLSNNCDSTGGHLNPFNKSHGAPDSTTRHVGDLGNIIADDKGVAVINFTDKIISLCKKDTGIIGRAIVVHAGEDDLGLGKEADSLTTGHAGARVGCGIVGYLSEYDGDCTSGSNIASLSLFGILLTLGASFLMK